MKHILTPLFAWIASAVFCTAATQEHPNIVLIFADDLGYGDIGCYGAEKVQTPNIDRLAAQGRMFTDAHSASAVCSPSRYGLLTGRYPLRRNLWGPTPHESELIIDTKRVTLASLMKKAGYATACVGKWHLGFGKKNADWNGELKPGPLELGFDYYFGIPHVNSGPPFVYVENHRVVGFDPSDPFVKGEKCVTEVWHAKGGYTIYGGAKKAHLLYRDQELGTTFKDKSVEWIKANKSKPFFLHLATTNIHHPFTPAPQFNGTSQCGPYGDFIAELDWIVGEVLESLDENGLAENTLVIFTSDNGGMLNNGGQKAWKAGHRLNGDLLGAKFGAWEGGHRIPMIIRWPGRVPAGSTSDALISHIDFLATFADIAGQSLKDPEDSLNQIETITGSPKTAIRDHLMICPNSPYHLSIRKGDWVYIPNRGEGGFQGQKPGGHLLGGAASVAFMGRENSDVENGKIRPDSPYEQLYNLSDDLSQKKNVIREHPEVAAELAALLKKELDSIPDTNRIGWINIEKAPERN